MQLDQRHAEERAALNKKVEDSMAAHNAQIQALESEFASLEQGLQPEQKAMVATATAQQLDLQKQPMNDSQRALFKLQCQALAAQQLPTPAPKPAAPA